MITLHTARRARDTHRHRYLIARAVAKVLARLQEHELLTRAERWGR